MAIKFNIEPYWDDYNTPTADGLTPKEKYNKMLFRPGHAVQARELTQMQSMLQNQVSSIGDHMFKEGSIVIPGGVSIYNKIDYLKLSAVNTTNMSELIGVEFISGTNKAKVVHAEAATNTDPVTLWINYTSGDKFVDGTTLADTTTLTATVASSGYGSLVSVDDGIYYIKKHFTIVKKSTIVLSKYTTDISYDVGLKITESIISAGGDATLNDNAAGSPNESAPGAHRYSITTTLVKQANNANIGNFVLLARLENGSIAKHARYSDYAILEDTLARRTFDESGNYTVNPFPAQIKNNVDGDTTKLSIGVEPSKAYVRGYEIQTLNTTNVDLNRARDADLATDTVTEITHNNYIDISGMTGLPEIENFKPINLLDSGGIPTGTVRVRSIQSLVPSGHYRLHVFDLTDTISGAVSVDSTSSSFNGTNIVASNLAIDTLIYPLPYTRIKTCSAETNPLSPPDYNYRFEANRVFRGVVAAVVDSKVVVAFNIDLANEVFGTKETDTNWILVNTTRSGVIVNFDLADLTINASAQIATIGNLDSSMSGEEFSLIAPIIVTKDHKSKTLVVDQTTVLAPASFAGSPSPSVNLQHCDVLRINSIMEGTDNVTEHFDFNNGQTDTHYDVGSIQLKTTTNYTVNSDLTVKYDYFDHSVGDFFTIDSYSIDYADIPSHNGIELRSAIDFRPRMKNAGVGFDGDGAVFASCPRPNTQFETDIQYYLNRIDKVYLDKDGEFGVLEGVSDLNPKEPGTPKDAMVLYHLFIPAYTLTPDEVSIKFIENRRYTMRDIGKLDRRIGNLEYYTTLSLLEKEAENKQILGVSGMSRWKSGFLVDSFTSTNIARASSNEFRAGIDRSTGTLRPLFNEGNIGFEYDSTSTTQRTGDLVTLPYTTKTIISQTQSSGTINVNPFDVFNWTGSLSLSPSSDEWKDTERRPQLIVNNDGVFDALRDIVDATVSTGTVWNSWQTNWSGSTSSSSTATSTSTNWWFRNTTQTTNTTTTTNTGQNRSGVNTTIGTDTVETNIGDRVVEVNFAPFMRSRLVEFTGTRMRPNTQVYPFFDGISVVDYVSTTASSVLPSVGVNTNTVHPAGATTLTTDANGAITGTFFVPNNESLSFKTGDKTFLLTDSSVNNEEDTGTFASETYSAKGLIETKENVVISTRVPTIQRTNVSDSRVITSTATSSSSSTSSQRIRWADPLAQSILLDIDGGAFITSLELFFSTKDSNIPVQVQFRKMDQGIPTQEVIPFSDMTMNAADVNVDGTSTKFTFEAPVYLQDGIEYCFVIMANSNEYKVKYAEIGAEDDAGNRISKQPYNGVMFKSQNASTWTPDQNKDLTFKMNRAVFDTTTPASLVLKNTLLPTRALTNDPFQTINNSSDVIVTHRNHGMLDGESVTIAVEETIASINGIPLAEIEATHTISNVERDKYTITTSSNAAGSGIDGNNTVTATQNLAFNTIYPLVQEITLPNTGMVWGIKDSTENDGVLGSSYLPVIINENYTPSKAKVIKQGSTSSLYLNGIFVSSKDNISPVVDMDRCSAITISNRIDKPAASAAAGYNVVANYAAETDASNGSVLAKYITKTVKLDETSDQIKVYLDVNRPSFTDVHVYHKTGSESTTFDSTSWVLINPTTGTVPYSDSGEFSEMEYTIDVADFTMFAIKIVFTSQTTAKVPSAQSLRAIALQA
jgi:hypothetical protein